ncbi:MAG: ROK family protein [Candidatus Fimimorpha sp.]
MIQYFKERDIEALGIACFGPIDLNKKSDTYGYITTTPKLAWVNYDIVGAFKKELNIPIGFDTDVNGSALGEATWGITQGLENSIYITIGTGVGMGIITNGKLLHGMLHPEAGHMLLMMPLVRKEVKKQLNGYLKTKQLDDLENYIVLPSLNDNQGIMGCLKLALNEIEENK